MLQFPADILSQHPHVKVKHAEMFGVVIEQGTLKAGTDLLQTSHCLELVLTGSVELHWGDQRHSLVPGDIHFRKRGNYQLHPSGDYSSLLFFMENAFILDFLKEHIVTYSNEHFSAELPPFRFTSSDFIRAHINEARQSITVPETFSSCIVKLSLHQILLHILAKEQSKTFVTFLRYIVSDRKVDLSWFMEKNFMQRLSLEDMARQSGRSLSSFKKDFATIFNATPAKWIIGRRLEYAQYKLRHSTDTVSEIAYECGFENAAHFSKAYRLKYGLAPTDSRK